MGGHLVVRQWSARFCLVAVVLLAACAPAQPAAGGASPAGEARAGPHKRVVAAIFSEPPTIARFLNPANAAGSDALTVLVNSGLTIVDRQGARVPRIAQEVPTAENGLWRVLPDGRMETTWRLRPGVTWHDGTAFTSSDVAFSGAVFRDREAAEFYQSQYEVVEGIDAVEPLTVVVRFKRPYIEADQLFEWLIPRHRLAQAYQEDKVNFTALPFWRDQFVGTGPFRLREWAPGSHAALEAYDRYFLGRPKLDELVVRFFQDANALITNLMAGAVEVTMGRGLSLEQALQLRERWREGRVDTAPANSVHIWPQFLNPSPPVVGDVRFRRALLHALDRQQLVETLEAGMSQMAYPWIRPDQPEFAAVRASIVEYPYDPARAVRLIEETGHARGPDGLFRDGGGQRLAVEIRTTESNDIQPKTMFAVADAWQQVGVDAQPMITPRQRAQDREYRAKFPAFELIRGSTEPNRLVTAELRTAENRYSAGNYPSYSNRQFDALVERYYSTVPRAERLELAGQIMRWLTEEVIVLPLFYDIEPTAVSHRLVGPTARAQESVQSWNAHEWDVRS